MLALVKNVRKYVNYIAVNLLILTIINDVNGDDGDQDTKYNVCNSTICLDTANFLLESMNRSAKPCDDFYEYACGGWIEKNPVIHDFIINRYSVQKNAVKNEIKNYLEESSRQNDPESLKSAREIYKMCANNLTGTNDGLVDLENILTDLGGWPIILPAWNNSLELQDINMKLDLYFTKGPFYTIKTPERDPVDLPARMITLAQPSLLMERIALIDPSYAFKLMQETSFIRNVVDVMTAGKSWQKTPDYQQTVNQDILDIIIFGIKLANITTTDNRFVKMSIAALQHKLDSNNKNAQNEITKINLLETLKNVYSMHDVNSSEIILVQGWDYFPKLIKLIENETPRTIVNYMMWVFVRQLLRYINEELRTINGLYQVNLIADRTLRCVEEPNLKHAIHYEYMKRNYSASTKNDINIYIRHAKSEVEQQILNLNWMDDATKDVLKNKLGSMRSQIGGPDWYSDAAIDLYYEELNVTEKYFETILNIYKFEGRLEASLLRTPFNITESENYEWNILEAISVEAVYDLDTNTLCLPAAVLDGFLYIKKRPVAINYGAIGFVIAHEIYHAFGKKGQNYNKNGDFGKWWSDEAVRIYEEKSRCFVDQYNNYTILKHEILNKTIYINGEASLEENIADTGVALAYRTYKQYMKNSNSRETRLVKMEDFTADQLFFISHANVNCDNFMPIVADILVGTDHAFGRARVHGSLSNTMEFATAFNCPPGSPMNPVKKCKLWE